MPAKYVRPYSKGQKNDFRDAEAIAEAVQRPTMKFVATKTVDQLDLQALHRVRELGSPWIGAGRPWKAWIQVQSPSGHPEAALISAAGIARSHFVRSRAGHRRGLPMASHRHSFHSSQSRHAATVG
jgi:hypothetical protein